MGIFNVQAQQSVNYPLYANIIYRFTKYINWPADKKSGDFVIGIVGDSPLYDEIKSFTANKKVGNQKIVIKIYSSSASFYNCQMLFICEEESSSLKRIAALTEGLSTLIISESEGLARKGSCINFVIADERLKLEINKNNIQQRNLDVASEFFGLGTIIK
ncbi:MAG: YfiR family protein [Ferruginibacter sp.]